MEKRVTYFKGFTLVEVLIVMSIFIILTVVGFNGFLSIRETFIAKENVELIIQDIESTRLKAMNMEVGRDPSWIYGFGIDFENVLSTSSEEDYIFFKWCSPVSNYGDAFVVGSNTYEPTKNVLPNLIVGGGSPAFNEFFATFPYCDNPSSTEYQNGRIPICYFDDACIEGRTGLVNTNEISTLLDRDVDQIEVLTNRNLGQTHQPRFLFFESLTGRAIIYNLHGLPQSYDDTTGQVAFNSDNFVPLDIVLHRRRSTKFDLITVYPNSGEIINHIYDMTESTGGPCEETYNILEFFEVDEQCFQRYGIDDEINSFRN